MGKRGISFSLDMTKYVKQLKKELEECGKVPIFEIEVNDKNCATDYVICEIFFRGNSIVAQRDGVSTKELKSKFIANTKRVVDPSFSLDENLQELLSDIESDIEFGDLFSINYN